MGFLKLALKNLQRHRTRSLLTLFGIAASVAVLFSILSFNKGFDRGLARELDRTGIHFMVVPSGCAHEVASLVLHGAVIPKYLDTAVREKINKLEGVALVSPLLVAQLPNPEKGRIDLVYGVEMAALAALKPAWEVDGEIPRSDDEVLLGSEVAAHGGIKKGATVIYPQGTFRVSGIVKKTGSQDDAFIYMSLAKVQALLKKPSGATAIGVKVKNPEMLSQITDALTREVPGIQIVTMSQVMNSISNLAASAKVLSLSIALVTVFISAVGVMNSILMAVFERTQEIGMMRAVGASRRDIFRIVLKETALLTLSGGSAGILLSLMGTGAVEAFVRKVMPYVPGGDMVKFEPALALASLAFSLVVGILAGLYPAWKASTINPIEAIKG
ncbi:MAG: FtsX-like permease family protein [Thermodesulfovibrionales bacterium]